MDLIAMAEELRGTVFCDASRLHHFASIGSTNTFAVEQAQGGAPAGQVYVADEQTAGRGRSNHTWHSKVGDGLYVSVLLRPQLRGGDVLQLSLATGLAAQRAIAAVTGMRIDLRWPNDLVMPSSVRPAKKLGGILAETAMDAAGALQYAVIGVGINLNQTEFAPELHAVAASLQMAIGSPVSRDALLAALLRALDDEIRQLQPERNGASVLERFAEASSWVRGKQVKVMEQDGYTGVTAGLDANGLLQVKLSDGSLRTVRHGGVREDVETA